MKTVTKLIARMGTAVVVGVACAATLPAMAQTPLEIKITAPAGAGGGWDSTSRALSQALMASGAAKSVQVVNVPGAGGTIGLAQFVNNAKGDGKQLLTMGAVMVGAIMTNKSPVTLDAVTPIARLTAESLVIAVPANSPHQTINDLVKAIKVDTSKVVWAGGSAGGVDHILAGLVTKAAGGDNAKLNYVPFSGGGEALAEMLGGRVTAGISGYNEFESMLKSGKLRALAVSSPKRMAHAPVPTLIEQGLNVELVNWRGVVGAPGLTAEQKATLANAVTKAVKSEEWTRILKTRGWEDAYLGPDQFAAQLAKEQGNVKDVLMSIGLVK